MADRPSAYDLWRQAGGGTEDYDRAAYRDLLREHGHLVPLDWYRPGEQPATLPCGWPDKREAGDD